MKKRNFVGTVERFVAEPTVAYAVARVTMSRIEGRDCRDALDARASRLGHQLKPWKESISCDGKFVSSCRQCGALAIMYETTPTVGDDTTGKALTHECPKGKP